MGREVLSLTVPVLEEWLDSIYPNLPDGFKVTGARVNNFRKTIEFVMEHIDLEELPEGAEPDYRMVEL